MTVSPKLGLLIIIAAVFPLCPDSAHSAVPPAGDSKGVDTVTIEAQRERQLKREVDTNLLPEGLSPWDQSFLRSLYTTNQQSVLQVSLIKSRMMQQIGGR